MLFFSCKKEVSNENSMTTISSSLVTQEEDIEADFSELSMKNYELEALQILEKGKKRLQVAVPMTIESQVDLYEETLQKFSEQAVSSRSMNETTDKIIDVEAEMLLQMMEDEVKLNKVYFDIVFDLEELNKKYSEFLDPEGKIIRLQDYHNSPSIVYSVDINEKIIEFVKSDKVYQKGRPKGLLMSVIDKIGFGIAIIPTPVTRIGGATISGIAKVGTLANDIKMEKDAGVPIPILTSRMYSALDNSTEREKLKNELKAKLYLETEDDTSDFSKMHLSAAEYESAKREFSGFGNRLKGRIGDFSDGIITQPVGHLRNLIEQNVKILENPGGDLYKI